MKCDWSSGTLTIWRPEIKSRRDKQDLADLINMMCIRQCGATASLPMTAELVDELVFCEGGKRLALTIQGEFGDEPFLNVTHLR